MKLRIAALLSLNTAVHGACDVCDGFNDSLTIDMSFLTDMGMGFEDEAPDGKGRARLLQALGATAGSGSSSGDGFFPETCAEMRAAFAETPDGECAMIALLAYKSCGCTGDPPPGSCYVCPDGSPVPDLEAAPALPAGMDMDWGEETEVPGTCGDLAFTMSFSALLFGAMAEGLGAMAEGMGEGAIDEGRFTGDCVPVNHVNNHPGHVTCDCVAPEDSCLGSGGCILDDSCPGSHGGDVATDNMDMDMGDLSGDMCAAVGLTCGCPQSDACDVCPFGLQEPNKVVEVDGETFTCEEGVATLAMMVQLGMDCGQVAAMAVGAGCLCKEEAGAAGPEATSPAEPAATSAPEADELSSPAETAATTETPADAPGSDEDPAATTETPADAPGSDEDPDDSGAGPLGLFVVTLMVAVGTIALA